MSHSGFEHSENQCSLCLEPSPPSLSCTLVSQALLSLTTRIFLEDNAPFLTELITTQDCFIFSSLSCSLCTLLSANPMAGAR